LHTSNHIATNVHPPRAARSLGDRGRGADGGPPGVPRLREGHPRAMPMIALTVRQPAAAGAFEVSDDQRTERRTVPLPRRSVSGAVDPELRPAKVRALHRPNVCGRPADKPDRDGTEHKSDHQWDAGSHPRVHLAYALSSVAPLAGHASAPALGLRSRVPIAMALTQTHAHGPLARPRHCEPVAEAQDRLGAGDYLASRSLFIFNVTISPSSDQSYSIDPPS
jgi:hypothetical protein